MEGTIGTPVQRKLFPWRQRLKRWLNYALQLLWIVAALYIAQLYILSIRPGYAALTQICTEPVCPSEQLTTQGLAAITRLGLSVSAFAVLRLGMVFAITIVYGVVSLLIFRAKRHDNMALYVALVLLTFGAFLSDYTDILRDVQPRFADLVDIIPGVSLIAFVILAYVFPDGRFFPRWTTWAAWGWIIAPIILIIATAFEAFEVVAGPVGVILLCLLVTCIVAPVQRYRKLSSRIQRQQLKWVLFGLTQLLVTMLVVVELLPLLFPVLDVIGSLPNILTNIFQTISVILFPITVGIALLRYRLWNVNLVINRTLVYVPLTSILTVIYTTSMALSQRLFTTATGEQPQAIAIFTTIVLTTTFSPIKNALQSYVDRNFKEAPEKLKELDVLSDQLAQVVQALDQDTLAQRVVKIVTRAHNASGAALYLATGSQLVLAYATPGWNGEEGEVSILLTQRGVAYGRLLLGQPRDREDYTLDEVEDIRTATLPIVANMVKLRALQEATPDLEPTPEQAADDQAADQEDEDRADAGEGEKMSLYEIDPSEMAAGEFHAGQLASGTLEHHEVEEH